MATDQQSKEQKFLWEVCGHENIVGYLKSAISANNLHHAYIFSGADGLGKKAVAEKMIQTLYCRSQGEYRPCGECPTCRQVASGLHPDVYHIRRSINEKTGKLHREILIDQIRELKSKLSQGTLLSSWKVALIEEAELLNGASASSFLKVLEEPTKKTIIIFLVNDLSAVLPTISSRCQTLNFLPVNQKDIKGFIETKFSLSADKANKIARLSLGRPGLAIRLAESQESLDEKIADIKKFKELIQTPLAGRSVKTDELIDWEKDESLNLIKFHRLLDNWLIGLRDLIMIGAGLPNSTVLSEATGANLPAGSILKIYQLIKDVRSQSDFNISSKSLLENLIINI